MNFVIPHSEDFVIPPKKGWWNFVIPPKKGWWNFVIPPTDSLVPPPAVVNDGSLREPPPHIGYFCKTTHLAYLCNLRGVHYLSPGGGLLISGGGS